MTPTAGATDSARGAPRRAVLAAVSLALFCIQLDFFALNLALPDIARSFDASTQAAQWTISAYMLTAGSMFIVGGRLGDLFGRRRALLAGVALFAATSVGAAVSPDLPSLIGCRILQGVGAALIFPVGIAVVSNAYPEKGRARALGFLFALANVGTALGPFVGGGLSGGPGWRWIFWLLAALALASLLIALRAVPDSREEGASIKIDYLGCALIAGGIAAFSIGVDQGAAWGWVSAATVVAFAGAAGLVVAFFVHEHRSTHPLVDLRLFRNLPYVLVTSMGATSNMAYAATIFVASLYLQESRGLSPLAAGAVFLAPSIAVAASGPLGARLAPKAGPAAIMAGAALVAGVSLIGLSVVVDWWAYVVVFAVCGLGLGTGWTFANVGTQELVSTERAGEASGVVLSVVVTMGGVGVAAAAAIIGGLERHGHAASDSFNTTLRIFALLVLGCAAVAMALRACLVRRGLVAPLSMRKEWPVAPAVEASGDGSPT